MANQAPRTLRYGQQAGRPLKKRPARVTAVAIAVVSRHWETDWLDQSALLADGALCADWALTGDGADGAEAAD